MRIREGEPLRIHTDTNELFLIFKSIVERYNKLKK